ncbi:MAG: DUF5054 domain-containing protein [Clostridia bacterium]|nr:DUF5054 domain-containing protein [Clostridia bacterium]
MRILVLFKTHLDVGFTDFSEAVVKKYNEHYIPKAISVAREVAASGRAEGFIWTTGSWLIAQYLRTQSAQAVAQMEEAIQNGWISWHALPCTMHSELCTGELYDYGLSLSRELDARFGRETIGSKCTDVPGHTAAIVPHLAKSGVTLLHIGVNPASTPADVPSVFRWRFEGSEVNVMYNGGDYGEFTQIPGTDTYVYFAHTGDNLGPQSAAEIFGVYDAIHAKYPDATVCAADLSDVARAVETVRDTLPVVETEMGDTWIHGAATDPQKMAQYRALLRYAKSAEADEARDIYSALLLVPEHTWGLDEKTHLGENENYIRPRFEKVRNNYKYKKMELSWAEQRRYVLDAADCVRDAAMREALLGAWYAQKPDFAAMRELPGGEARIGGMRVGFSESGEIVSLHDPAAGLALDGCHLFGFSYDEYSFDEVWAFQNAYLIPRYIRDFEESGVLNWGINDFGKYGLQYERNKHTAAAPLSYRLYTDEVSLHVVYEMDARVSAENGQPPVCMLKITPVGKEVPFDFAWFDKPANSAPEAMWLRFDPGCTLRGISKLGHVIDPANVVGHGGRGLHATDGTLYFDGVKLQSMDAVLVSIGGKNVYRYVTEIPNMDGGVYINLFNNQWGTNFPMWCEGDGRARFVLSTQ